MEKPPSLYEYLRAFKEHWLEASSGASAMIAGLIAAFMDSSAKYIVAGVSVAAFFAASYTVWSRERRKVVELETKARPRLRFGEVSVEAALQGSENVERALIKLHNDGDQILERCLVKVIQLSGPELGDVAFLELPVDVPTRKQADRNADGNFTLRPGQAKDLILAEYYPDTAGDKIIFHYEHKAVHVEIDATVRMQLTAYSESPASLPVAIVISVTEASLTCLKE